MYESSPNTPCSTRIIFMSGTPTGELHYFGLDNGKPITKNKEYINDKPRSATFVASEDKDSCFTSFIKKIRELLGNGHRVYIPTNMGEKWINCVVTLVGNPKFNIYSNNQKYNQLSDDINKRSIINENIELIFVTTLGNVGIDINNEDKTTIMVIYTDNRNTITGQEIEQYANRFRKINVGVYVFFVMPKHFKNQKEFVFDYVEDSNTIRLIENDIPTNFYADKECENMYGEYGVDRIKVRWKKFNEELNKHNTNIISIGGRLKTYGYDVLFEKGEQKDSILIKSYRDAFSEQEELENLSKIKALDFILSDVLNLIKNINNHIFKSGEIYSLIGNVLTLENEKIFRTVRLMVKRFLGFCGYINDISWIKILMEKCKMNFVEIENTLKYMEYLHWNNINSLDDKLVNVVDKIVNMKDDGIGCLEKWQYYKMLDDLAPEYSNKAYNDSDEITKEKLRKNLRKKLDVCYIIYIGKKVTFKQRHTQEWRDETTSLFMHLMEESGMEAPTNERIIRNRKGQAKGLATGKAKGLSVGKAYENINEDMITAIKEKLKVDGFINVQSIVEITSLPNSSVGHFIKLNFSQLRPTPKMVKGVRETRYC